MTDLLEYPGTGFGIDESPRWGNIYHRDATGKVVQVRATRSKALHPVKFAWNRAGEDVVAFFAALDALKGGQADCYFYTANEARWHTDVAAGVGDGANLVFPFGGRSLKLSPASVVKVAGVTKTLGTHYQIGIEQRLKKSEDFSDAGVWTVYSGSAVTRTAGQADPAGGTTAWRIQTSGGTNVIKMMQGTNPTTPASGQRTYTEVWISNVGAKAVTVGTNVGGASSSVPAGANWTKVQLPATGNGATFHIVLFSAPAAGDSLDFHVWHPWAAWEIYTPFADVPTTSWGYLPSTTVYMLADSLVRDYLAFYPGYPPALAAIPTVSFMGRRLLLGRVVEDPTEGVPDLGIVSIGAHLEGEEV